MSNLLLMTDWQQSVLGGPAHISRAYSPYGAVTSPLVTGLAFCGQNRDPLTGNYPLGNGHRVYSPTLMRFQSPDALSPFERGGINAYGYCAGDPVNRIDPSGRWMRRLFVAGESLFALGGALGAANVTVKRMKAINDLNLPLPPGIDPPMPANPEWITRLAETADMHSYQVSMLTRVVTIGALLGGGWATPVVPIASAVTAARGVAVVAGFAGVVGNGRMEWKRAVLRGNNPYRIAGQAFLEANNPASYFRAIGEAVGWGWDKVRTAGVGLARWISDSVANARQSGNSPNIHNSSQEETRF